ncbi:helix-turn-helix domain-containing protein [Natranaerovirga pectinivora]|nr:helix-turn-helix transcriptional regulator [Natranaerovirga pectinivora]
MNFSRNLATLRKVQNITQEALAEKCGVSRQAVTKWECGSSLPDLYKLSDLAEILSITVDELLHGNLADKTEEQIDRDYFAQLESKMDSILTEVRQQNENIIDEYIRRNEDDIEIDDTNEDVPVEAFRYWAMEEAQKGNYDDAIDYLEQALVRGDISAVSQLIVIHQEILYFCIVDQDEYECYNYELKFAQKIQKYGRIMEYEIKKAKAKK